MKKFKGLVLFLSLVLLISLAAPALAAPPDDNPGKGPPEYDVTVFVHYGDDARGVKPDNPGGGKGGGGGGKNKEPKLYSYSGVHWEAPANVTYGINPSGAPGGLSSINNAIIASFETWDVEGSIDFSYDSNLNGTMPGLNVPSPDRVNVIGWADLTDTYPNAIGVTIIWSLRGRYKYIVDVDTILNTAPMFAWTIDNDSDPDSGTTNNTAAYDVDVQNIMTHEAGHWLVLNDLYDGIYSEQTMFGVSSDTELKRRTLEDGDIAGILSIYPSP